MEKKQIFTSEMILSEFSDQKDGFEAESLQRMSYAEFKKQGRFYKIIVCELKRESKTYLQRNTPRYINGIAYEKMFE